VALLATGKTRPDSPSAVASATPRNIRVDSVSADAALRARKLHKRLHTHRTFDKKQVDLNGKPRACGAFCRAL
jgi:hypothetical protein